MQIKEEEEKAREELSKQVEAKEEENIAKGKLEIDDPIEKEIENQTEEKEIENEKNSLLISWDTKKVFLQGRSISLSLCKNSQTT